MGLDLGSILTGGVFSGISDIIARFKADPNLAMKHAEVIQQVEAELEKAKLQADVQLAQAQTKINEIEAASEDKYTSRWRPTVGWVCCFGLVYAVLGDPLLSWVSLNNHMQPPPSLNTDVLTSMLFGLLGLAGMRSFEKTRPATNGGNGAMVPK